MVISNDATDNEIERIINDISTDFGIKLNCGIGIGRTGKKGAAELLREHWTPFDTCEKAERLS